KTLGADVQRRPQPVVVRRLVDEAGWVIGIRQSARGHESIAVVPGGRDLLIVPGLLLQRHGYRLDDGHTAGGRDSNAAVAFRSQCYNRIVWKPAPAGEVAPDISSPPGEAVAGPDPERAVRHLQETAG